MNQELLLVDASSYIFRAFYGIRSNLTNLAGEPTNAVFGFKNMLLHLLETEQPSHVAIVFDSKGKTFRNDLYPEYKANRSTPPDDLKVQFPLVFELTQRLNLPILQQEGVEADDLIGSMVEKFKSQIRVKIVSGDKDLTQLVTEEVVMLDTMKDQLYTPAEVKEKFGVGPELMVEYLALCGDSSDNIPGAAGIGPKTAVKLFEEFGSIAGIYANIEQLKGKQKENLLSSKENVELSLTLTQIKCDLDLPAQLSDFELKEPDYAHLAEFYQSMRFRPDAFLMQGGQTKATASAPQDDWDYTRYRLITQKAELESLIQELSQTQEIALDFETDSLEAVSAKLVGLSLAAEGVAPCYIPFAHQAEVAQLSAREALALLQPLFGNPHLTWVGQNIKFELSLLRQAGVELKGQLQDSMIESYLLDANSHRHNLDALAELHLHHKMISFEEVCGKGQKQITFDQVPLDQALRYAAEDAEAALKIHQILRPKVRAENLDELFEKIEMPLTSVLAKMEVAGVKVDSAYLGALSQELTAEAGELEHQIHELAGEVFNLNSTQQLGRILFEKLGIQDEMKKTKTGYSTDASVLEKLALHHPIAALLLEYRSKTKLVNTYLDVLPTLVNPKTGRIHTHFSQVTAATGRLSSKNPNLQNIPIKGEIGQRIRMAFVPEEGYQLLSADYSQIELRFLAHLSEDQGLIEVFSQGGDIHRSTAAAIYNLAPEAVTQDQRRAAKAINFGIIYGMGAFRLAQEIGVSNKEAKLFIEAYFARYPKIKSYMDSTLDFAKEKGYVETLFGRKREIPDIHSKNHIARTAAERVAINSRIQGSAADLIKIAMVHLDRDLLPQHPDCRMILQVHDELVFEIPAPKIPQLLPQIRTIMESAAPLKVPLQVDAGYGKNWGQAH